MIHKEIFFSRNKLGIQLGLFGGIILQICSMKYSSDSLN